MKKSKLKFKDELYAMNCGSVVLVRHEIEDFQLKNDTEEEIAVYELKGTIKVKPHVVIEKGALKPKLGKIVKL